MGIFSTFKTVRTATKLIEVVNQNKAKTAGDILECISKLQDCIDFLDNLLIKAKTALAKLTERLENLK